MNRFKRNLREKSGRKRYNNSAIVLTRRERGSNMFFNVTITSNNNGVRKTVNGGVSSPAVDCGESTDFKGENDVQDQN
jgi:hypothetical protein